MFIREANNADFPKIWPMLRDVFRAGDTYAVDPAITEDAARIYWMDLPAATYVVCDDTAIIGTYYIKTNQPGGGSHICNCGYIVSPDARGQGMAGTMCAASQVQARALGYTAMQFNFVLGSNRGALRLWHKFGFVTVGTIPDAFLHPTEGFVPAHVLYKSLLVPSGN